MKSFFITAFSLLASLNIFANDVLLHERVVTLPVDISKTRLRLSSAGYGENFIVKVIIPELADVAFLNHRNPAAGGPCMATYETKNVNDVIQNDSKVESIPFTIQLTKNTYPDLQTKKCYVSMTESITGKIRGFKFEHTVSQQMPERRLEDCR